MLEITRKKRWRGTCRCESLEERTLFSTYFVGPIRAQFHTIQAAVNAVVASNPSNPATAFPTVEVNPGTYTGQVYVPYEYNDHSKLLMNLTIESIPTTKNGQTLFPNLKSTTIQSPAPLSPFKSATGVLYKTIIWDAGAQNLTIQGFTISGPAGKGPGNIDYGILATGGTVTINGNIIKHIQDNPLTTYPHGDAIEIQNPTAGQPATSAVISYNSVSFYQKAGISIDSGGYGVVHDNVVTGNGAAAKTGQNGIQVGNGGGGNVYNNTISNNAGHSTAYAASGILLFKAGPTTVNSNTVFNNDENLVVDNAVKATVTNNTISGGLYDGIDVFDQTTGADVEHNSSKNNALDGIFVESGSSGNTFQYNTLQNNGNDDEEDLSSGTKTGGTANTWQHNTFNTSNPGGLH